MATDTGQKDGDQAADRAGKIASNAGASEARQVKNDVNSELRQRFGFLNRFTGIFRR